MKLRINKQGFKVEQYLMILFSISIFFDSYCYFTWSTFNNRPINLLAKYMRVCFVFALFFYAVFGLYKKSDGEKKLIISKKMLYAIIVLGILGLYLFFGDYAWKSGYITIIAAFTFILLGQDKREYIFKAAMIAFALMVLPSMVYYLLNIIGVNIPHTTLLSNQLAKYNRGWSYSQYPFGLITRESNFGKIDRYCGIFDESGYIGSLAALFIAGGYGKVDRKWIVLLTMEGIFSLSMAFYVLLILFAFTRAFLSGAIKSCIIFIVVILSFNIFVNTDFHNASINHLQNRIDLSSIFLVKDNRASERANDVLNNFLKNGGLKILFGYGDGSANKNTLIYGSSSYKMFVYDYGIFGTILFVLYFVFISLIKKVKISVLPFIIVFLASFYQRPYIFTVVYITIFAGAVSLHSEKT